MSVSCSLRTSCSGTGCISSMNPPTVSFPRERDRPGSWGSCFQMAGAYTDGSGIWPSPCSHGPSRLSALIRISHHSHPACSEPLALPCFLFPTFGDPTQGSSGELTASKGHLRADPDPLATFLSLLGWLQPLYNPCTPCSSGTCWLLHGEV